MSGGPDPVDPPAANPPAANPRRPQSMAFQKRRRSPPMPAEQSRRQSRLMQSAWRHFGDAAPVIAFLNTRHDALDALPLHLAVESDEGLERVETLLEQMKLQA